MVPARSGFFLFQQTLDGFPAAAAATAAGLRFAAARPLA
jgi:hypothetical protein